MPGFFIVFISRLRWDDVSSLLALGAGSHIKSHALVFFQRFEAFRLDRREMRKKIFSAIVRCNKPETLGVVEPLYSTCCHCIFLNKFKCGRLSVSIEYQGERDN